ncbi:MAG: hypothetical protein RDU25_04210 [Patescibacteria group bacterium]|nr:hypothetical protein [Patescibacteria group bacterium]
MAQPIRHELSAKDLVWLEMLSAKIWQRHQTVQRANLSGHTMRKDYCTEKRSLTRQEFKRLERLIRAHELPCTPGSGVFGFGLSLTIFAHSASPGVKPDALIRITGKQLPLMLFPDTQSDEGKVWEIFSSFTHTARNRELLSLYGFEPPREREYYEY